jgi:hypothetical protein
MTTEHVSGWLAAPLAALVLFALPLPEWMVETFYSRGIFFWWQAWVTSLSNLAPVAFLDLILLGVTMLVVWRLTRLVQVARERSIIAAGWEGCRRVLRFGGLFAVAFLLIWGLNYRRVPLDRSVPIAHPSVDELRGVISDADALAARFRPSPVSDAPSFEVVTERLHQPLNDALAKLHRPPLQIAGRPKYSLILTPFFTWAGVNGMVNPFGLETILHPDLLPFERPVAVGHEWAHLAGTADEGEASAVGWLACMNGQPEFAYSASLYLIVEAGGALPPEVWAEVSRRLDPGIRADLASLARRQERQRPAVQRTAFRVYDGYLRANHVDDGLASYNRALSLILSPPLREALSNYRVDRER